MAGLPTKEFLARDALLSLFGGGVNPLEEFRVSDVELPPEMQKSTWNDMPLEQEIAPAPVPAGPSSWVGLPVGPEKLPEKPSTRPTAALDQLVKQLNQKELSSLKNQSGTIAGLKEKLAGIDSREMPLNLQPLAALVDTWTGSRFAPLAAPQETAQTRAAEKQRLQDAILRAEQGLSENEIALLRSQLNNEFQMANLGYRQGQDVIRNDQTDRRIAQKGMGHKVLPASAVSDYTDFQGSVNMATDLSGVIEENARFMGPVSGGVFAKNPYDKERRELQGKFDLVRQKIGKMVEGGVLRKEDESKYEKILPNIKDLPDVAKSKAQAMEAMLKQDLGRYMENFGKAGYDVSGFAGETAGYKGDAAALKAPEKTPTPEEIAAAKAELAKRKGQK